MVPSALKPLHLSSFYLHLFPGVYPSCVGKWRWAFTLDKPSNKCLCMREEPGEPKRTHSHIDSVRNPHKKGFIRYHVTAPRVAFFPPFFKTKRACLEEGEWQGVPTSPHTAAVSQQLSLIFPPQFTRRPPSLFISMRATRQDYMYLTPPLYLLLRPLTHRRTIHVHGG